MKTHWERYGDLFSMAITGDLTTPGVFYTLMQDIDVVVHVVAVSLVLLGQPYNVPVTHGAFCKPLPDGTGNYSFEEDVVLPAIKETQ